MKLRYKLILAMLIVAVVPLGIAGYQALDQSRAAVEERIRELLAKTSRAEAEFVGHDIRDALRTLSLVAEAMELDTGSLSDLSENLTRAYLLSDRFNAVVLLDATGTQVGPAIFVDDRTSFGAEYGRHEEVNDKELATFLERARAALPGVQSAALGGVYTSPRKQVALLPVLVPLAKREDESALTLAVELSLDSLQKRFEQTTVGSRGFAFLVDGHGRCVLHKQRQLALRRTDISRLGILARRLGTSNATVDDYTDPDRGELVGAFAPVPWTGWAVVVAQPTTEALVPVRQLGVRLLAWLGLGLALAGFFGLYLARRITRPVQDLVRGARAIAGGKLGHKIPVSGRDEIGGLGQSFNYMGDELRKKQEQIASQTEEIKRWNIELQKRVDDRTRELNEAQHLLMDARKMAAVGELGAGVAHEINNPLMGVLGSAQLLLMRHPEGDPDHVMLNDIEREAQRIRTIVTRLLETSQTGRRGMARVQLRNLVLHVVEKTRSSLGSGGIHLEVQVPEDLPPVMGNSTQLEEALAELFENARRSMPDGGRLLVAASGVEGELVKLEISDEGCGIPPDHQGRIFEPFFTSKQDWKGQGLGLSMVYNTVLQHNAKINVRSEVDAGTTFTLVFPALRRETHLR